MAQLGQHLHLLRNPLQVHRRSIFALLLLLFILSDSTGFWLLLRLCCRLADELRARDDLDSIGLSCFLVQALLDHAKAATTQHRSHLILIDNNLLLSLSSLALGTANLARDSHCLLTLLCLHYRAKGYVRARADR